MKRFVLKNKAILQVIIAGALITGLSSWVLLKAYKVSFSGNIYLCTPEVEQGGVIQFLISGCDSGDDLRVKFNSCTYEFYPAEDNLRALIGVPAVFEPGEYELFLEYKRFSRKKYEYIGKVAVRGKKFKREKISFSKKKKDLYKKSKKGKNQKKDRIMLEQAYKTKSYEQLWEGKFKKPLRRRITSPFGARRVYLMDNKFKSYHRGMDFSAPTGTRIYAANSGRVILAKCLALSGNVVAIDHGQCLVSLYKHLSKIDVKEGQMVKKGEVVGTSGSTGISTGAHLHWEIRIHGVPVNPMELTKKEF